MAKGREGVRRAMAEVVGAEPMPRQSIVAELSARGVPVDPDTVARVIQDHPAFAEVEAGVVHVPHLLDGTASTVWVDADDARDDFVRAAPHLQAMTWWLLDGDVSLVDEAGTSKGPLAVDSMWLDGVDSDVVIGPDGWLADLAGGWATVRVVGDALSWTACPVPPPATSRQVAAMRAGFEAAVRYAQDRELPDRPPAPDARHAVGDDPIHEALVADRPAFVEAPIPPLPSLYEAAGLEEQDGILAERGFDWDEHRAWQDLNRLGLLYGLDNDQIGRLLLTVGVSELWAADDPDALGSTEEEREAVAIQIAGCLDDGAVAEAFWVESERGGTSVEDLGRFAADVTSRLGGDLSAGLAWVRARSLELEGDGAGAVALLATAVAADDAYRPALIDLAGFYADRGDAPGAYALLRRAGVTEADDDDYGAVDVAQRLFEEVQPFAIHRPRPAAARNDRCPCGSGRKYKACHLGRERHPLDDRAVWLYEKAQRFLRRRFPGLLEDLAAEVEDASGSAALYREMAGSALLADVALHEGGVFAEFLHERHDLLPDDEALLASQWSLVGRGVFEVEAVERGRLKLRDIGRGERVTVLDTFDTDRAREGAVLVGRPLPAGEAHRGLGGFLEISRGWVDSFLAAVDEGNPVAVATLVGRSMRPPQLHNSDGEDLVFHTIRWRCPHTNSIDAALREAGLKATGDDAWSLVRDSANQKSTVIATLRLVDGDLIADVNSDDRADEMRALVAAALPDAEFIEDDARPFAEMMADYDPDAVASPPAVDDPAIEEALRRYIAEREQQWLDESIPALGGRTPREAALDPIGREELDHLLSSFPQPQPDGVGMMDVDRLRAALGL